MKTKEGVALFGLKTVMRQVLIVADRIWTNNDQELVITSTVEGVHSPGSLHPYGYAVDLRTNYFTKEQMDNVYAQMHQQLDPIPEFRIIRHDTHMHVEWRGLI